MKLKRTIRATKNVMKSVGRGKSPDRVLAGWEIFEVEVELNIDIDGLVDYLGNKAFAGKGKVSHAGHVQARVLSHRKTGETEL